MANDFLYDLPVDFYRNGCTTDGKFDPEKAEALGYSEAQFPAIKKFLGEDYDTAPLPQTED